MSNVDHATCRPDTHDRDPGTDQVRPYDQPCDKDGMLSDKQSVDADGLLACNDCGRPLFYCTNDEDYHHVDPGVGCFLSGAWRHM